MAEITATFPTLTFGQRGVQTRDDFVQTQEAGQDTLSGAWKEASDLWKTEANDVRDEVNTLRNATALDASDAADSANTAASLANNKGAWSALTGALNIPASVNHNNYVWIVNTNLADVTASEPSDVNTDWTKATISPEDYYTSDETDDLLDQKADVSLLSSDISLYPTTASGDFTYNKLVTSTEDTDYDDTAQDVSTGSISGADQLVGGLIAEANLFSGNPGQINITTIGNIKRVSGGTDTYATFYFKLFKRDSGGTETLVATSSTTDAVASATYVQFYTSALLSDGDFEETDRLVLKFYASKIGSDTDPVYNFQYGGTNPVRTLLPIPVNISLGNYYDKDEINIKESDIAIDFSSDANITLTDEQCLYHRFILTDTGVVLTTARNIVFNSIKKAIFFVQNDTAQDITIKLSASTGTTVSAGQAIMLKNTGADIVDSEEYFDDGLLGVPDTGFSSTGARIYPDGTIRGKSSYGEYVKHPDGTLVITQRDSVATTTDQVASGYYYEGIPVKTFPIQFVGELPSISDNSYSDTSDLTWGGTSFSLTTSSVRMWLFGVNDTVSALAGYIAIGRWK